MSFRDLCDWAFCAACVVCFGVLVLLLLMTPFFDDWDDDEGKGE